MKKILALMLCVLLVAVTAACGGNGSQSSSASGGSSAGSSLPEAPGGEAQGSGDENITILMEVDLTAFDPIIAPTAQDTQVLCMLNGRLYDWGEDLTPEMELAKEVVNLSDTEWQITLHQGVKFHDGSELKAEDVVYSLQREGGITSFVAVESIDVIDDYTLKITTSSTYPALPNMLSTIQGSIFPKAFLEQAEASGDWSNPIGCGRYKLESRKLGSEIVLTRFDDYFEEDDRAQNTSLTYKVIPEGSTRTIMIEKGEADINLGFSTADYDVVMGNPDVKLHSNASSTVYLLAFDTRYDFFDNKLVRQAINYAVDRQAVIDVACDGFAQPLYSVLPPSTLGHVPNPGNYSYDLEKAKALMAEAGYADGFSTTITAYTDTLQKVAEMVQANLAEINITLDIKRIERSQRLDLRAASQMPLYSGTWGASNDPDLVIPNNFGEGALNRYNWMQYVNPELEELIVKGRSSFDPAVRIPYYVEIQELLAEDAVWCPLFVTELFVLSRADLQGVALCAEGPYRFHLLHY